MAAGDVPQEFIRQSLSDFKDQFRALREQLSQESASVAAQLRSITVSINSNNTDIMMRLTALEVWKKSYEDLVQARLDAVEVQNRQREVEIEETAVHLGQSLGRFEDAQKRFAGDLAALVKAYEQAEGASKLWKWLGGAAGFALVVLNIIQFLRRY